FEKDDLAVSLPAGLEPDTDLVHGRVTDPLALLIHAPAPVRRAHPQATFADGREHRVAIAAVEKFGTLTRVLEQLDRVAVLIGAGRETHQAQGHAQQQERDSLHTRLRCRGGPRPPLSWNARAAVGVPSCAAAVSRRRPVERPRGARPTGSCHGPAPGQALLSSRTVPRCSPPPPAPQPCAPD